MVGYKWFLCYRVSGLCYYHSIGLGEASIGMRGGGNNRGLSVYLCWGGGRGRYGGRGSII